MQSAHFGFVIIKILQRFLQSPQVTCDDGRFVLGLFTEATVISKTGFIIWCRPGACVAEGNPMDH